MKDWNYDNDQWTKLPPYLKHLPLFTRHLDVFSISMRFLWAIVLKYFIFMFYVRIQVIGDFAEVRKKYPKLILMSNHTSHVDAVSIAASVPMKYWPSLYITAAKDYFFSNPVFTFFSKHCLGAIPIDRKDKKGEAIGLILNLLTNLDEIWLILFPEGTRSKDGKIHAFKRGVSIFAEKTKTSILFLYIDGNAQLWPKGALFPKPGKTKIYIGPIIAPAPIDEVYGKYRDWVSSINPNAFDYSLSDPQGNNL
jgi:1-acyl-sn-glycerol-3-phosphate acyltransferase